MKKSKPSPKSLSLTTVARLWIERGLSHFGIDGIESVAQAALKLAAWKLPARLAYAFAWPTRPAFAWQAAKPARSRTRARRRR